MAVHQLVVEPTKHSESPDGRLRTVWGHVYDNDEPRGVYYVRWNQSLLDEATFVVSIGDWSDGATPSARRCVAALARAPEGALELMLIDADATSFADQDFLGHLCMAREVRGTPLADEFFHIIDHLLTDDPRVTELRERLEARGRPPGRIQ